MNTEQLDEASFNPGYPATRWKPPAFFPLEVSAPAVLQPVNTNFVPDLDRS